MLNVLAFDPGGTTGWALVAIDPEVEVSLLRLGEFPEWSGVEDLMCMAHEVIYESFVQLGTANPVGMKCIGVIEYLCQKNDIKMFHQPSAQRVFIENRFPGITKGYKKHHKDALMHALSHAYFQHNIRGRDNFTINQVFPEIIS